jgi:RNA-directed DNA polymerase
MLREKSKWEPHKDLSTDAEHGGGVTRSSEEESVMGLERRGYIVQLEERKQPETGGLD